MPIDSNEKLMLHQAKLAEVKAKYHDFFYTITHDLASPVRQVEGFADIVLANHGVQFDDNARRHLDLIIKGSQKGKGLSFYFTINKTPSSE